MKYGVLAYAIGYIDDGLIEEAELPAAKKEPEARKASVWLKLGAVAAAACIVAAVGIGIHSVSRKPVGPLPPVEKDTEKQTEQNTESETERDTEQNTVPGVETETETETDTEYVSGKGGGTARCKHTGGKYGWNNEYHDVRSRVLWYVGGDVMDWFKEEPQASGFDGIGEGSKYNLYDYIHTFNIPKEITEIEYIYSYEGYNSVLTQEVIDMIYEDRAEDFENFFINLGPADGENAKRVERMSFELQFFVSLYTYENRYGGEKKEAFDAVKEAVIAKFDKDYYKEQYPDYTGIFSIPEVIYLNGMTEKEVNRLYKKLKAAGTGDRFDYDIDSIFTEREKYEKMISDARALEDPMEMLRATRAINESLRK